MLKKLFYKYPSSAQKLKPVYIDNNLEIFDGIQMTGTLITTSATQCRQMLHGKGAFAKYYLADGIYLRKNLPQILEILKTDPENAGFKGVSRTLNTSNYQSRRNHIDCRHTFMSVIVSRRYRRIAVDKGLLTREEAKFPL